MARTALEDREQILADLAAAIDRIALATACLGQAYEGLDEATGDRLEQELFRPVQKAFGRAKRTYTQFAARFSLPTRQFESPPGGAPSQGVKMFVERAVVAASEASQAIAALQDSMLPAESGDAELRTGLAEAREGLDELPSRAREFTRTLGR